MKQEEIYNKIDELEREIASLPSGSISKKNIRGKDYYYHRVSRGGKRTESYVSFAQLPELKKGIEKRKKLEARVKTLRNKLPKTPREKGGINLAQTEYFKYPFHTNVIRGRLLKNQINLVKNFKKRECISTLRHYVFDENPIERVLILYGLRRTGKTTMIRQILSEMSEEQLEQAAFIQVSPENTLKEVYEDLRYLQAFDYKYVFVDEVTLLEDFIHGSAIFSDVYAACGMKVVLSGTDSLGFAIAKHDQLYDRTIMIHTTFIPYREFERLLGIDGIDEYIKYGGLMCAGGVNYNFDTPFANETETAKYIDSAIANNIQHSLVLDNEYGRFRPLIELYDKGELTNVINRVVEDINHRFAKDVVDKAFKSHDISLTAANLFHDKNKSIDIYEKLDIDTVTKGIKDMLEILDEREREISVNEEHMLQIREYLKELDIIDEINFMLLPSGIRKSITVVSQPGIRYAQAMAVMESISLDKKFAKIQKPEKDYILSRLISEIKGRMMEEIVLLETKIAFRKKDIYKVQFMSGEIDMLVYDKSDYTCEIYEIKHSDKRVPEQYRHICDSDKCQKIERMFGKITGRYVIYRGEPGVDGEVMYLNVEEYLRRL